jgi:methyl-accepting chemotaxis protein
MPEKNASSASPTLEPGTPSSRPARIALKRLRTKILVFAAVPVAVLLLVSSAMLLKTLYMDLHDSAVAKIGAELSLAKQEIERGNLESTIVPEVMAVAQENGLFGRRLESARFARRILELYPQFTGAYFGYETNADQQDSEFLRTASPEMLKAATATGRFLPYWFRNKTNESEILLTPLADMETSFYYQGTKNRALGVDETQNISIPGGISSHYHGGRTNLMKNMIDGKFVGIAGVDRALTAIDRFLTGLKPFKTADLILVSRRGRIISATMNPALKTKRIEDTPYREVLMPFYLSEGANTYRLVRDPVEGKDYFYDADHTKTGNWLVVMRVSKREIFAPVWRALGQVVAVSVTGFLLTLAILVWLANSVAGRVAAAAKAASQVAEGDLTATVAVSGSDETGVLLRAIRTMTGNLNALISKVKTSSIQLISTATQISSAAKSQEATVSDFGSSTNEIAAAVNEISATSQELAKTMGDVTQMAGQTAQLAAAGRGSLGGMETTMHNLSEATTSISSKLSVISEKAKNITSVVTTITKVADQTNLLSLNAAIEAEKAGEYGLGFSVVAREIRRLADRTAVATLDIDQMVKEMQSAVSSGVMEMDKFTDQVRRGVDTAGKLSDQLGLIIEQVQNLTPRFESVNQGMHTQSEGAKQISEAMLHLTEAARTTSASIQEFNKATGELHEAVRGLREEISRFKVD